MREGVKGMAEGVDEKIYISVSFGNRVFRGVNKQLG